MSLAFRTKALEKSIQEQTHLWSLSLTNPCWYRIYNISLATVTSAIDCWGNRNGTLDTFLTISHQFTTSDEETKPNDNTTTR